ncbi:uncharacterized protein LOC141614412 [Silene latifolia]|uniref:uncharacterized protein LOC141614412 n=1 Tax=Silene latifolia TaxID=37657 RepID=UPI003D7731D2
MAPKRGRKKVGQVVKTTKVVSETVEVSILGTQSQDDEAQLAQSPNTKVMSERREEHSTVTTKSIPIEVEDDAQNEETETETQEPEVPLDDPHFEKLPTPPLDEEGRPTKRAKKQNEAKKSVPAPPEKREKIDKNKVGKKNRKKGRRMKEYGEGREGYKSYVFKVLKQVHPGMGVSGKAMTVINNLMSDMFERLANEAGKLGMHAKKQTLTAREIQAAVKLVLPGELGKHAIAEGSKALTNYINYHNNN